MRGGIGLQDKMTAGQRDAMVFSALSAPVALLCGGKSILWALPPLFAVGLLYAASVRQGTIADALPKWLCTLELVFLITVMAKTARLAELCWAGSVFPLFPLALLALAAAGASGSVGAAGSGAALLTWALGVLLVITLVPTLAETEAPVDVGSGADGAAIWTVLLTSMYGVFVPAGGQRRKGRLWAAVSIYTMNIVFVSWGRSGAVPFLTAVKNAELLGTFQRYEALAACAITIGLWELMLLLSCAGNTMLKRLGRKGGWEAAPAAAGFLFVVERLPQWWYVIGMTIFCGAVPATALCVERIRKNQKTRKK